jgi:hypothetical protein
MPYTLKDIPRTEFGDGFGVGPLDLSPTFALPMTTIAQGAISPDKIGLPFANKTGGTLTAGTLVYTSGWDSGLDLPTATKASATGLTTVAGWIVLADTLNNAQGLLGQHYQLTGQNTNSVNIGDPVWLNTTAGGFTLLTPPAAPTAYQQVGVVRTKSATVGVIELRTLQQPGQCWLEQLTMAFPTVATSGVTISCPIQMDRLGSILGIRLVFVTGLAINGTNYVTFSANNQTQSKLLTQPAAGNNTNTGGTAITALTGYPLTLTATAADLIVAASDILTVTATVTGTLGATLTGSIRLIHAPV